MSEGIVETSVGRVHYVRVGSGHPLFLMHSNGNSIHEWDEVIDDLAASFDVIAVDQPGQGGSDVLPRHLTIDEYSDVFIEVLDALGVEKAAIAGTSIGGFFVISMAARYPERTSHALIIEAKYGDEAMWAANWHNTEANFGIAIQPREKVEARFNVVTDKWFAQWNIDRSMAGARSMMSTMWAIREYDIKGESPKVNVPTMLMLGTKGPCIFAKDEFAAALPNCEVVVVEDSGHFPMIDQPAFFVEQVVQFCSK